MSHEQNQAQGVLETEVGCKGQNTANGSPAGQAERSTPLICKYCQGEFVSRNRNGKRKEFCSRLCKDRYGNAQRLKGAAILKAQRQAVQRPRKPSIRTLDQLSAAEGLPEDCYPAGALGKLAGRSTGKNTLADLVGAAKRLGLTEEGPTLKAARAAAAQRTAPQEVSA